MLINLSKLFKSYLLFLKITPSQKMLIFLYISLEKRQHSTINNTKFKAALHKNSLGEFDTNFIQWTVNPKERFDKFSGYVFSWDFLWGKPATHLKWTSIFVYITIPTYQLFYFHTIKKQNDEAFKLKMKTEVRKK